MKKCVASSAILFLVSLAGCAIPPDPASREFGEQRQREWDELNQLKGQLQWDNDRPVRFSFPENGDVTVRSWHLEGGPGWEYVRAEFTYHNTTADQMEWVDIELHVMDGEGQDVAASRVRLSHPWGLSLAPGTFFSDEIKVPTTGVHNDPSGWHWTVVAKGVPDEEWLRSRRVAF